MNYLEKRREPRHPASGVVTFRIAGENGKVVQAALIDVSPHGFRATHTYPRLSTGQEIWFEYGGSQGRARVIWTRIMGAEVQSGFLVLLPAA